ncbi:GNAT family N-acetyltransferase [Floricoccus penangensis]
MIIKINDFKECFCFDEEYPELLGAAILSNNEIVAMAGINQSGKYTLEIGISVLPEYQGKGYATKLVKSITARAHLEFPEMIVTYDSQFTHNQSINVAIRSGFEQAWSEIFFSKNK